MACEFMHISMEMFINPQSGPESGLRGRFAPSSSLICPAPRSVVTIIVDGILRGHSTFRLQSNANNFAKVPPRV